MCGIAGYYGIPAASMPRQTLLHRMIDAIAYRGPDAQGTFVGDSVGLAHARLSIIDLASGQQPMASADGALHVTFNGEIFNYIELRDELIARGHRFVTTSDTEVILHAYEAYGADCVEKFNGDFAFAIFDSRNNRLMLARDRMGVRPLFHTTVGGCLYFGSEVKALL
jgi:asparagine synthase (glutamine-hydrolysing)